MAVRLIPGWMVVGAVQAKAPAQMALRAMAGRGSPARMPAVMAAVMASPPPVALATSTLGQGKRAVSPLFLYLGNVLSAAAIAMLIIYSLYGVGCYYHVAFLTDLFRLAAASAAVVVLQMLVRNPLLSIIVGTAVYMILVQY